MSRLARTLAAAGGTLSGGFTAITDGACAITRAVHYALALILVFMGGFAIMVLEIVGARLMANYFGSSFYVWVSQIGVILMSLALGYYAGGALADRWPRAAVLGWMLVPCGVLVVVIPSFAGVVLEAVILRHPAEQPVPLLWQKLDPALGSAVIFLIPGFVLAMLAPCMIRLSSRRLAHVGRVSGLMYAASTVGSIAGVFVSGYILLDHLGIHVIFRLTGGITLGLGILCFCMDRFMTGEPAAVDA